MTTETVKKAKIVDKYGKSYRAFLLRLYAHYPKKLCRGDLPGADDYRLFIGTLTYLVGHQLVFATFGLCDGQLEIGSICLSPEGYLFIQDLIISEGLEVETDPPQTLLDRCYEQHQ